MKRNSLTNLSKLSPGDCFYKAGDKSKKTLAFIGANETDNEFIVCPSAFYKGTFEVQRSEILKKDIEVVYLMTK